jgi:hypothetical protein
MTRRWMSIETRKNGESTNLILLMEVLGVLQLRDFNLQARDYGSVLSQASKRAFVFV